MNIGSLETGESAVPEADGIHQAVPISADNSYAIHTVKPKHADKIWELSKVFICVV